MTHSLRKLYIALFLALLLALGLWSITALISFNRTEQMTVLNGRWAKAVETHYDDEFPIKRLGTNLWAAVDYTVFKEGRPGVVLGRDQWLYTDEEIKPVLHGALNQQENLDLIRGVRDALQRQGVQLVVAVIPAKTRVYPEHLGERRPVASHGELYQDFHVQLTQAGIFAPDLLGAMEAAKAQGQVFLRTDTHWTPLGADVVAGQLARFIAAKAPLSGDPQTYVTDAAPAAPYKGDLTNFLPLDPLFSNLLPKQDQLSQHTTRPASQGEGSDALFGDAAIPVALVGTSYSANPHWNFVGALQQALHSDVANYAEDGHGPILPMLKYLQSDALKNSPPQVVVWEFPERYLPMKNDLSDFDPKWIAQLKTPGSSQNLALTRNDQ